VRNVYVIGPDKKVKLVLSYPMSTGRNFDEVLRVLDSMQLTAKHKVATPVNWKNGDDVIMLPAVTEDEAKQKYPQGWKAPKQYPASPSTAGFSAPSNPPTISPAAATVPVTGLSFTMNKWNDATAATGKTAVNGAFKTYQVQTSKPASELKTAADLAGLTATVTVDLASLDTANETRNGNIRDTYFEVGKFAKATFTFSKFTATGTPTADRAEIAADGELDLHGMKKAFTGIKLVAARKDGAIQVTSAEPISIKSADFGLPAQALLAVCKHLGIDDAATVNVDVTLR